MCVHFDRQSFAILPKVVCYNRTEIIMRGGRCDFVLNMEAHRFAEQG